MPPVLRSRLALAAMFGVFLVPIVLSSLRGLTHVLTCRERVETPFQVILGPGPAVITGATSIQAGGPTALCGGIQVALSVAIAEDGRIEVAVPITNQTGDDWYGTVQLDVAGTRLPVDLGKVGAGETHTEVVRLRLPEGTTEFSGSLFVGP